jgi:DNA-binding protein H-NS
MKFKRKGTKAKAKYRDPATGTTWSGRGKEPHWIKGASDRTPFEI